MITKKKKYARPRKPFEAARIAEENLFLKEYGLKNKREVWKALAKINYFRKRAMSLTKTSGEEQEVFINKLKAIGIKVNTLSDVLAIKVEDLFERRLPTVVTKKRLANTVKQARQMVTHKRILVDGKVMNSPSYLVPVAFENKISIKEKSKKAVEKNETKEAKQNE